MLESSTKSNGRYVSEEFLKDVYQEVNEHQEDEVEGEVEIHGGIDSREVALLIDVQGSVNRHVGQEDEGGAPQELGALREINQSVIDHHACGNLHEQELLRERSHDGTDERDYQVGEERSPGVEKGTDRDGDDGIRDEVFIEHAGGHAPLCHQARGEDTEEEEQSVFWAVEDTAAERTQVEPIAENDAAD